MNFVTNVGIIFYIHTHTHILIFNIIKVYGVQQHCRTYCPLLNISSRIRNAAGICFENWRGVSSSVNAVFIPN